MGGITVQRDTGSWAKNGPTENFCICKSRLKTRELISKKFRHFKIFFLLPITTTNIPKFLVICRCRMKCPIHL